VGAGKVAIIKSTILPCTTASIQKEYLNIFVFHSPEFLTEVTALHDAANPNRNIIGIPKRSKIYKEKARAVLAVLPKAPFELVTGALEAELIKYGGNCWFYFKVIFINMLYDVAKKKGIDWATVRDTMAADPRIGRTHLDPLHKSGRGAGGHCFIKDFAAFADLYREAVGDSLGRKVLESLRDKNVDLLLNSDKDFDLLHGVYGESFIKQFKSKK
jgi:UDPglucose 6-dehydrogenase